MIFDNQEITYQELNQRANQLANYLRVLGINPEVIVGICTERSIEMIIGILGILKAGGAYVPLDPDYPTERLRFMLEDAQVSILLTQKHLVEKLPVSQARIVCLDTDVEQFAKTPLQQTKITVKPHNLAYIIYTSGSTGEPKGVLIPHCNVVRLFAATQAWFQFNQNDVWSLFHSYAFDFSVWEIFGSLLHGGRLVIIPYYISRSPELFYQLLSQEKVTVLNQTPSAFQQLMQVEQLWNHEHQLNLELSLRLVIFGGESLDIQSLKPWFDRHGDQLPQVVNMYGITETTVHVTYRPININDLNSSAKVIGSAIPDLQIYILNSYLQPVPIGVAGEIYVGGAGLARGYLNRPELTNEKFIAHPFNHQAEARLYKTGDLGRYLPNGDIEYLGRIDNQVKIRGFRIELGEIEAVLNQHTHIKAAKVISREEIPGDQRLVAYLILNSHEYSTSEIIQQIREYLKQQLPNYMIPAAFVVLDSFPLTQNGKIDYRALPAANFTSTHSNYIAPRTPQEEIIANIWSQVLKVNHIGINDNFFELGGHSLLATQVISRIRQTFHQEIPLRLLFEYPTIRQFSQHIDITKQNKISLLLPPIQRRQHQQIPLSFAQKRLWFLSQLEPNSTAYNMPLSLRIQGLLNIQALERSIAEIIERHDILRTNFQIVDGEPTQVITNHIDFRLSIIDLQSLGDEQREEAAINIANQEAKSIVDLLNDFLFRVKMVRLDTELHLLLFNIHHIIFDGWSEDILQREIATFYQAFSTGDTLPLPSNSIQYADFALWQHHWLTDKVLDSQLSYWKQQLSGTLPILELPTDYPRPQVQTYQGASHSLILSPELTATIKSLCQKAGVTLFMILLAAFKVLLCRYSGQEDIIVGTPIAGRNRKEIEDLIGFFVNTLALRTDLTGNPSFQELLNRVRQVTLDAYTHQDLPFEKLVEELQPERNLSHTPIFQVWFNMINLNKDSLQINGLKFEDVSMVETTSKFDLTLYIREENHQINLQFVYNKSLFNLETIQYMSTQFQRLLESVAHYPEKTIYSFPLITETESHELSHRRNLISPTNSFVEFQKPEIEQSIPSRFEQQVKKYPHHFAVKTRNYEWTYDELNIQANRIAQAILAANLSNEAKIALLFDHDAPMIAAILGVMKAGKTYVPIDSQYPRDRVLYILKDSLSQVILTNSKNLNNSQYLINNSQIIINIDHLDINDDVVTTHPEISPDTIAYILYTSGSTGNPKGVIQNHRNVLHFIRNHTNNLHISSTDRLCLLASYSFDAAIIDIFSALLNGATLYPYDIKTEGLIYFSDWLSEQKITVYHSTPTVYRHFLQILNAKDSITKAKLSQVRLVVLGGEQVVKSDVELYQNFFADDCILVNGLGSTESSFNLQYLIDKNTQITQKFVPVGYAFEDTEIILLDDAGNQTDICGEIAIKSHHVALGYWQKPELTKAVFFDDPQGSKKRIYRTGDLGRLRANGIIECLGRKDFQVKIRGFRVELAEIEAVLNQHPQVRETVVIAREDIVGDKQLAAYIVTRKDEDILSEVKHYLRQKLPSYMIPIAVIVMGNLPLTPNGKINRLALPAPDFSKSESTRYTTPSDNLELQLTKIWEQVLGIKSVDLDDNFFDIGGHSLLAVNLFAEIEKILHKNIPLTTLFQAPTIRQLANVLREEGHLSSLASLVPIQKHRSKWHFLHVLFQQLKLCIARLIH
ncbi:non-ribosomal peptide synthetase [Nostoc sp. CMAA1605]|uniref:non-ribosomal peptide synthetase n=1 Tax=Nostoc sp. CMAA1605 TaxID=2055159 RepID=UPI001F20605E|nr:non-ribosomal peptide synthetase [Nostoc sp. CMAA1605]MCF4968772.1 hypothetical protein [Nostoc sp. CMAA1605]